MLCRNQELSEDIPDILLCKNCWEWVFVEYLKMFDHVTRILILKGLGITPEDMETTTPVFYMTCRLCEKNEKINGKRCAYTKCPYRV